MPSTLQTRPETDDAVERGRYPERQPVPRGYYGYAGYPEYSQLEESLNLVKRGKWIILLCLVASTAAAYAYTSLIEPEYEASTLLLIQPDRASGLEGSADVAGPRIFGRGERSLSNELIVLRSSLPIARSAASRLLEIDGRGEDLQVVRDAEDELLEAGELARRLQWNHIRVGAEGRDVDVVRVTATSARPDEAALLANTYAEEYIKLAQEASRARITASRNFLEQQLAVRYEALREVEEEIQMYMQQKGAFALDSEGESLIRQLGELEAVRDEARVELQMRRASLREREQELKEIHPQLSQGIASGLDREIRTAQERLVELELARNQILVRNPGLRDAPGEDEKFDQLTREIGARRAQLEELSRRYVDEVMAAGGIDLMSGPQGLQHITDLNREMVADRVAISGLESKIEVLAARLREHEAELSRLPEQAMALAQLQRSRLSAERMYTGVAERLQELRIAEESELGYATIIREALEPAAPVRPNTRKNVGLGVLFGLVIGFGAAAGKQRLDKHLYSLDDARRATGNVIGAVPRMSGSRGSSFGRRETVEVDGRAIGSGIVTLLNGMSPAAEAFRHIRTNIQFSRPEVDVRTIVVTSASPGEGKTTTAANVAVVMAQSGRRTLLLDADLRRPTVHRLFGQPSPHGLVHVLFNPGAAYDTALTDTGIERLHVLPVDRSVDNPSELLGSASMRRLLEELRQIYDVIVIDTPPVLAATDAVLLANQCDATVVVTRAGMTGMPEIEHCMTLLTQADAHVVGGVLNGFDPPKKYAYGYGYAPRKRRTISSVLPVDDVRPRGGTSGELPAARAASKPVDERAEKPAPEPAAGAVTNRDALQWHALEQM